MVFALLSHPRVWVTQSQSVQQPFFWLARLSKHVCMREAHPDADGSSFKVTWHNPSEKLQGATDLVNLFLTNLFLSASKKRSENGGADDPEDVFRTH